MISDNNNQPVQPLIQLAYVIPRPSLKLLPTRFRDDILEQMGEKYPLNCKINWAFCKYFWESHPELPFIDINNLKLLMDN
jgi:5'-3' exonuclease